MTFDFSQMASLCLCIVVLYSPFACCHYVYSFPSIFQ